MLFEAANVKCHLHTFFFSIVVLLLVAVVVVFKFKGNQAIICLYTWSERLLKLFLKYEKSRYENINKSQCKLSK